jgi:hypothetical protein
MLPVARKAAVQGGIDPGDAERWAADIRARTGDGEYFFATVRFVFVAVR